MGKGPTETLPKPLGRKVEPSEPTPESQIIVIKGKAYDITNFSQRHPGGTWINKFAGQDCTCLYESFHPKEGPADKWLKMLEVTNEEARGVIDSVSSSHMVLNEKYLQLCAEFENAGYFRAPLWFILATVLAPFTFLLAALYSVEMGYSVPLSSILFIIAYGLSGFCMHHSGHLGVTGKSKIDHKLQAFTFDWGIGLYAPWWRVRHNRHHASPNDAEIDPDLETPPLLLWHKDLLEHRKYKMWAGKPIVKKLLAIQRQMLFIYLAFYTYFLHFGSRRLASKDVKNPRKRMDTMGTWANIVFLVAIFALTSQPWWRWVAAWMGGQAITGIYIGWIFALNHFAMPLAKKSHHFVETVLRTTLNVSYAVGSPFNPLSRTIDFATGYLGYQVEHHLFPRMPACHYPHVHERVRQWVAETLTDVPFIEMDWMAAHKTMMNALVPL